MREQRQGLEWILSFQRRLRVKQGCTKDLCCHLDVITEFARESALSVLLYGDDVVLMSETIEELRSKL